VKLSLTEDIKLHLSHYIILVVILNIGLVSFFFFQFNPSYQMAVIFLTSIFYVLWGIIHHLLCGDLHIKIILEYILIAMLANLLVGSLIFRA